MDGPACRRSAIESLGESLVDGVVSPVFWYAAGGIPGIVLFKIVSTMDSMVGYRTERYRNFGWCGARLDDLLNLVPARVTWLLIAGAAAPVPGASGREALRWGWRQHAVVPGPNAGWSEAALAGAIRRRLGGSDPVGRPSCDRGLDWRPGRPPRRFGRGLQTRPGDGVAGGDPGHGEHRVPPRLDGVAPDDRRPRLRLPRPTGPGQALHRERQRDRANHSDVIRSTARYNRSSGIRRRTEESTMMEGMQFIFRWLHVFVGIIWIGHLYFFNFVNAPLAAKLDGPTKQKVVPELMPRALFWFRWGAAWTWITGVLLLLLVFYHGGLAIETDASWGAAAIAMIAVTLPGGLRLRRALEQRPQVQRPRRHDRCRSCCSPSWSGCSWRSADSRRDRS